MLVRRGRFLVGSLSSLVWPAVTVFLPMGITFAAARVYAEAAPAPEACDAAVVVECADAAVGNVCHSCPSGTCACFSGMCKSGDTFSTNGNTCRDLQKCEAYKSDPGCQNGQPGSSCQVAEDAPGKCTPSTPACLPSDGGPAIAAQVLVCVANDPGTGSSSGALGASSGSYIPGPPTVPGSSGAAKTPAASDDSGCATSPGTTLPLLAAPIALGLLFALRRKKKR